MNPLDPTRDFPEFSKDEFDECVRRNDFRPILFEWYKYVGILCVKISNINPDSQAFRKINNVHYAILTGLLNRCARLMTAVCKLSSTRRYGETTRIIDRCILETAIKIQWLCQGKSEDRFSRYMADGLRNDILLKDEIKQNIEQRGGEILVIEQRMINSIDKCIRLSGLTEDDIKNEKRLPNLNQIFESLNLDSQLYTAFQRMGSHAVHGTWADLIFNYLQVSNESEFLPRDHDVDTQDGQFISIIRIVLSSIVEFLNYMSISNEEIEYVINIINKIDDEIYNIQKVAWVSDFDSDEESNSF